MGAESFKAAVGKRIAELRRLHHVTMRDVAGAAGLSLRELKLLEAGQYEIDALSLCHVAALFKITVREFFDSPIFSGVFEGEPDENHDENL